MVIMVKSDITHNTAAAAQYCPTDCNKQTLVN